MTLTSSPHRVPAEPPLSAETAVQALAHPAHPAPVTPTVAAVPGLPAVQRLQGRALLQHLESMAQDELAALAQTPPVPPTAALEAQWQGLAWDLGMSGAAANAMLDDSSPV